MWWGCRAWSQIGIWVCGILFVICIGLRQISFAGPHKNTPPVRFSGIQVGVGDRRSGLGRTDRAATRQTQDDAEDVHWECTEFLAFIQRKQIDLRESWNPMCHTSSDVVAKQSLHSRRFVGKFLSGPFSRKFIPYRKWHSCLCFFIQKYSGHTKHSLFWAHETFPACFYSVWIACYPRLRELKKIKKGLNQAVVYTVSRNSTANFTSQRRGFTFQVGWEKPSSLLSHPTSSPIPSHAPKSCSHGPRAACGPEVFRHPGVNADGAGLPSGPVWGRQGPDAAGSGLRKSGKSANPFVANQKPPLIFSLASLNPFRKRVDEN